jgi:hypothetical protein
MTAKEQKAQDDAAAARNASPVPANPQEVLLLGTLVALQLRKVQYTLWRHRQYTSWSQPRMLQHRRRPSTTDLVHCEEARHQENVRFAKQAASSILADLMAPLGQCKPTRQKQPDSGPGS